MNMIKHEKNPGSSMSNIFRNSLLGLSLLFLPACLDTIDIDTPISNQESLVIQGRLVVGETSLAEVKLSKLFNFTAEGKQPVNARSATLFDEDNNSIELEDRGLGNYSLQISADDPNFQVISGKSYGIRVNTFDGRTFESALEKANPVPEMQSIDYRLVAREIVNPAGTLTTQELLQYTVTTPIRSAEVISDNIRLGWDYFHTFKVNDTPFQQGIEQKVCYLTQNLNVTDIKVVDAGALTADLLENYELYETIVSRVYGEGLYFNLIQESLSESAHEYFTQVAENTGRTGNMFEAPPGKVVTNIRNINDPDDEAFGFFYATQQDTLRKFVDPELIGSPPAYCPPPGGLLRENGTCADPICCDCISVPNSSTAKPHYWVE